MNPLLELTGVCKSFTMHLQDSIRLPVVAGVAFAVEAGECVALAGPSGAGKSSVLKMIFGNYRCDAGEILVRHDGERIDVARADPRAILKLRQTTIGYVSQFLRAVPRVAALDVVAEPLVAAGVAREDARGDSTCRSACGRCRRRPSRAENSSGSTSRAASCPTCRSCCSTSRPPRSTQTIVRS